jgi:hypothetical protein
MVKLKNVEMLYRPQGRKPGGVKKYSKNNIRKDL